MFLVDIRLQQSEAVRALLDGHRTWLKRCAEAGYFLLFGPYDDRTGGLIIAKADSEAALQKILAEDVYYHHALASYRVTAFQAAFITQDWQV